MVCSRARFDSPASVSANEMALPQMLTVRKGKHRAQSLHLAESTDSYPRTLAKRASLSVRKSESPGSSTHSVWISLSVDLNTQTPIHPPWAELMALSCSLRVKRYCRRLETSLVESGLVKSAIAFGDR